jgi:ABC-2 type transport system permease protein
MTTHTTQPGTARTAAHGDPGAALSGLTFGGVLRSEGIKLRSLRSTVWCYAIVVALTIGIGALVASVGSSGGDIGVDQGQAFAVEVSTLGLGFAQLVVSVLGALVITGEYGTGMVRSTLTAVPRRLPALLAKAIVFGVTTFLVGGIAIAATALLTQPLLAGAGIGVNLGEPKLLLALLGGAGYLALIGEVALALGAIIRNTAGGIGAALGLGLVVPTLLRVVAGLTRQDWATNLNALLPSTAGAHLYSYTAASEAAAAAKAVPAGIIQLDATGGLLVLAAWLVVLFSLAALLLTRRDA